MAKPCKQKRAVIYTRVSRVGDRSGASYISPEVQRDACEAKAREASYQVIDVIHEEDVSGGDAGRKGYRRAISMIEGGQAEAIIVYNISRFSRSAADGAKDIERITEAGGDLLSCANDIGDNTATGRFQRNVFLAMGQMQREQAAEGFAVAQARAIGLGMYTASRVPFGYVKNPETRKLEIDPDKAPVVKRLFEMRAAGESWTNLAKHLITHGGSPKTDRQAVKWIIQNKTYLGHVFNGDLITQNAHPAMVSQRLFDEANAVKGKKPNHNGRLAAQTLLNGLVVCGSCGHVMAISGNARGIASYLCRTVNCPSHASIQARLLDAEVIDRLKSTWAAYEFAASERLPGNGEEIASEVAEAQTAYEDATYLLEKFEANKREYLRAMKPAEFAAELAALRTDVKETRSALEIAGAKQVDPGRRSSGSSSCGSGPDLRTTSRVVSAYSERR